MSNFLMLVHNENMKIYRRVRTWVMLGIIIVMSILIPYLLSSTGVVLQPTIGKAPC